MLIQREWMWVKMLTYSDSLDEYGQQRQSEPTISNIKVIWKLNDQMNVNNPDYVDVDVILLTKDNSVSDSNQIMRGNDKYNIKKIIPGKYNQIFLKRV